MRGVWKRNLNSEKQAAISSQDLRESFVESLDWHDDFDDNVKIRFGRGLKAVDETISDSEKIDDQNDRSTIGNKTNVNSEFNFPQNFHDNCSIFQDRKHNNTPTNLTDIYNVRRNFYNQSVGKVCCEPNSVTNMNGNEDLEVAEQKYVNRRTLRSKRATATYRTLHDDSNSGNSDEENNLDNRFSRPNFLEDRSDRMYREYTWNDLQDLDHSKMSPRDVKRKKENLGKNKQRKHFSEKHAKKSSSLDSSSSNRRNRRHHAHRSDASNKNANRNNLKPKMKKNKAYLVTKRTGVRKSKTGEQGLLRAEEAPIEKVLYENVEDQSVSDRRSRAESRDLD